MKLGDIDIFESMPDINSQDEWMIWYESLSPAERNKVNTLAGTLPRVAPNAGPQRQAYNSKAEVLGYGGAAGGGKTALIALLSILEHERTVVYRFDAKQLRGLVDDLVQFMGTQTGLNRQDKCFYFPDRPGHMIEWGGIGNPGSEQDWRGRAHDLLCADEVTELQQRKLLFLLTWMRSVKIGQRCRAIFTFNPPGTYDPDTGEIPQGRWVIPYFAPWIDDSWPEEHQAAPGELRYFLRNEAGEFEEVPEQEPRLIKIGETKREVIPQSRTFIPATVQDNPYLSGTTYEHNLAALESPFREQMLLGSFKDSVTDHPGQVIPTKWIEAAMERWNNELSKGKRMSALGVDVARGGPRSFTVATPRYGLIFDPPTRRQGPDTPTGRDVGNLCFAIQRHGAPINVDATGVGSSAIDSMNEAGMNVHAVFGNARAKLPALPGKPQIYNRRTWMYWLLRILLNPENKFDVAIYPNSRLKQDLVSILYNDNVHGGHLLLEDKNETKKRLGRSPDDSDSLILTLHNIQRELAIWDMVRMKIRTRAAEYLDEGVTKTQPSVYHRSKGRIQSARPGGWMSF